MSVTAIFISVTPMLTVTILMVVLTAHATVDMKEMELSLTAKVRTMV